MVGHPASHRVSRARWYSGRCCTRTRSRSDGAFTRWGAAFQPLEIVNRGPRGWDLEATPNIARNPDGQGLQPGQGPSVWTFLPFARRYLGVRVCFSDRGTEMFQFPRSARSGPLASRLGRSAEGFPHSVILGSQPATRLPEAFRGVPRPSSPSGTRGIPRVLCVSFSSEVVNVRMTPVLQNHIIMRTVSLERR